MIKTQININVALNLQNDNSLLMCLSEQLYEVMCWVFSLSCCLQVTVLCYLSGISHKRFLYIVFIRIWWQLAGCLVIIKFDQAICPHTVLMKHKYWVLNVPSWLIIVYVWFLIMNLTVNILICIHNFSQNALVGNEFMLCYVILTVFTVV